MHPQQPAIGRRSSKHAAEPEDVILWKESESGQSPVFGAELDNQQRRDLDLLEKFTTRQS